VAHDVFISYSSQDKAFADAVCAVLESHNIRSWIAPRDITFGRSWPSAIVEAINGARVMVLVFSQNANASPQVEREVERAINKGIPVIPMRVEDVKPRESLEFLISVQHWLDAFTPPPEPHLERLAQVIGKILNPEQPPVPQPTPVPEPRPQPPQPPPPPPPPPPYQTQPIPKPQPAPPYQTQQLPKRPEPQPYHPSQPLFITFVQPRTGERKQVKAGFAWDLCFTSSFLLWPLFGVVFFLRKMNALGVVYLVGSIIFYLLCFSAENVDIVGILGFAALIASVVLGFKGNEITAKNYLKLGWVIHDANHPITIAAREKLGLK
jgi:hypothetical protein